MAEYDNTYVIDLSIDGAALSVMITLQNLRTHLSSYMHNHVENEVLYILSGEGTLVSREGEVTLSPHMLCVIPAGLYHHMRDRSEDLKTTSIRFRVKEKGEECSATMRQIIRRLESGGLFLCGLQNFPFHEALWDSFLANTLHPPILYQDILRADVSLIFCHIFSQMVLRQNLPAPSPSEKDPNLLDGQNTVEVIEHILSEHYMDRLTLDAVAHAINMSRSNTQRIIKNLYGIGFSRKLTETRLIMAQSVMQKSSAALYDIAAQCGYNTYDHFSKCFKAYFGVTPEKYRKNLRANASEGEAAP